MKIIAETRKGFLTFDKLSGEFILTDNVNDCYNTRGEKAKVKGKIPFDLNNENISELDVIRKWYRYCYLEKINVVECESCNRVLIINPEKKECPHCKNIIENEGGIISKTEFWHIIEQDKKSGNNILIINCMAKIHSYNDVVQDKMVTIRANKGNLVQDNKGELYLTENNPGIGAKFIMTDVTIQSLVKLGYKVQIDEQKTFILTDNRLIYIPCYETIQVQPTSYSNWQRHHKDKPYFFTKNDAWLHLEGYFKSKDSVTSELVKKVLKKKKEAKL